MVSRELFKSSVAVVAVRGLHVAVRGLAEHACISRESTLTYLIYTTKALRHKQGAHSHLPNKRTIG